MKRAVLGFGLVLGLVFLAAPAGAQTGTARGKVTDSKGQPIVDARVLIEYQGGITPKFEVKTNKKGEWMQVGMQPGLYRFTASKEGYQASFSGQGEINLHSHLLINTFLAAHNFLYTDKSSMAASIEVRVPFLDP